MASPVRDPKDNPGTQSNMEVDYVITYRFAETGKADATAEFEKLIRALYSVGLATEVRNGANQSVLIFVRVASQEYLYGEVYRSRVKDWLHGVRSAAPDKETEQLLNNDPLVESERLRIVYQMIANPKSEGGAGITAKEGDWKNIESIFPLHDHVFNRRLLKTWATKYVLDQKDLDEIRERFGEKIAFYFAFTQAYFTALVGIAAFSIGAWALLGYFSITYAIANGLWCVCFVEYWRSQELDLAVRWGSRNVSTIETKRKSFQPDKMERDPVTGEMVQVFPATKRLQRQLLIIPFAIVAALMLGSLIATAFGIEIFISEIYNGPLQSVLVFLPTGILTTCMPVLTGILTQFATRLTEFENYATDGAYETAMTQKIFVLNFITSYLGIMLTAFVYVPFAKSVVPYLDIFRLTVRPFATSEKQMQAPSGSSFSINPARLRKQVIYFTVTAQIVNFAMEVVMPYLKRKGMIKYKEMQSERAAKRGGARPDVAENDPPEEAAFLKRVREEAELDKYDVTTDLREMVIQFGYLALFSVVWPLTSVSFLVNNWIELRADAAKICVEMQRPTPMRADTIGPWLDSLGFLTWLGSITSAAIVYLFSNDGLGPDGTPENIQGWSLLLSVFFSEHIYFLVRWGIRVAISKSDTPGRQKERRERYMVRRRYLEDSLGEQANLTKNTRQDLGEEQITRASLEEEARKGSMRDSTAEERFWERQRSAKETISVGRWFIERAAQEQEQKKRQ